MAKYGKGGGGTTLKKGLYNKSPKASDASTKLPTKVSVNSDATRKGPAPTPRTLGPREA